MKTLPFTRLIAVLCWLTASGLWADSKDAVTPTEPPPDDSVPIPQEFTAETSYTGRAETKQGNATLGSVGDINSHVNYVINPQIHDNLLLRFGVDAERNSFSLFSGAPLPNTLQSVNAVIGADMTPTDKIILRAELHPGLFSDFEHITGNDFDMPVQIGGSYLLNKDFQLIFGLQIDLKSNLPVVGLPGFRWQFADKWVLSAIPPKPQLQFQLNRNVTLYTGAEILGGTYHLNDSFGSNHGHGPGTPNSQLNGNIVDYTEFRVGAGVTWKLTHELTLDVSGGYMPYRDFDVHADRIGYDTHSTSFHNNIGDGAPYAEIGLTGSF